MSEDLETLSAKLHDVYQVEAKRQAVELGRHVRHPDNYFDMVESAKEYDRALARFIQEREARLLSALDEVIKPLGDYLEYMNHDRDCANYISLETPCGCGFDDAQKALNRLRAAVKQI